MHGSHVLLFLSVALLQLLQECSSQFGVSHTAEINDIRLATFSESPARSIVREGFFEIKYGNSWYRVCKEGWSETESFVACGNLGFSESVPLTPYQQNHGQVPDEKIRFTAVFCYGTESRLSECTSVISTRKHCRSGVAVKLSCRQRTSEGIRLLGGGSIGEGSVQIAQYSSYGGICGNRWDLKSGNVACRQLGFGTAKRVYIGTAFEQGQGTIWLSNIKCRGREKKITDCQSQRSRFGANFNPGCRSRQLASVSCFTPKSISVPASLNAVLEEVNLLDGQDNSVGRVVVNIGGKWGSICSDNWGLNEAVVVCRQLGLGYASKALQDVQHMTSSRRYLDIAITNVRCTGLEGTLRECKFTRSNQNALLNCGSRTRAGGSYVGVACTNRLPDLQLDIGELQRSVRMDFKAMQSLRCAAEEKCLASSAYTNSYPFHIRKLLRLTVTVWNRGTADFFPWQEPREWDWHACHRHYHSMAEFAHYEILAAATPNQKVAEGHKVSFCLSDTKCEYGRRRQYHCNGHPSRQRQGISVGCADAYYANFDCQWIDITDVAPGNYIIKIRLNPARRVAELNYNNNNVVCQLTYTGRAAWARSCRVENNFA